MEKPIHLFKCSCKDSTELNFSDFKEHLAEVHNITTSEDLSGKREMRSHIDYAKSYSSTYEWTLTKSGLKFTEYFESKRSKEDLMYHL
jgi:hypothetical protein